MSDGHAGMRVVRARSPAEELAALRAGLEAVDVVRRCKELGQPAKVGWLAIWTIAGFAPCQEIFLRVESIAEACACAASTARTWLKELAELRLIARIRDSPGGALYVVRDPRDVLNQPRLARGDPQRELAFGDRASSESHSEPPAAEAHMDGPGDAGHGDLREGRGEANEQGAPLSARESARETATSSESSDQAQAQGQFRSSSSSERHEETEDQRRPRRATFGAGNGARVGELATEIERILELGGSDRVQCDSLIDLFYARVGDPTLVKTPRLRVARELLNGNVSPVDVAEVIANIESLRERGELRSGVAIWTHRFKKLFGTRKLYWPHAGESRDGRET